MATKRYFEFSEGSSNKFWEVWCDGVQVFTRYGKIGAAGQVTVKKVGSDPDAKKLRDKLIGEKTAKGYVEGGGKPAAKPAKATKGKPSKAPADDAAPEVIVIPDGAYRLEGVEKKSPMFWQIWRQSKMVTVTSGPIGTPGKVQKTKFKEDHEARRAATKMLEEKTKQGYQFVISGPRVKPMAAATNPQLEAAVVKDPGDGAFMVYGDWLMEQNDPRGAMLAFKGDDKKRAKSQAALAMKQRPFFFGPLAVFTSDTASEPAVSATWRHGWIDSLRLSATRESWRDEGPKPIPVNACVDLVRLLPKLASARLTRELVIGLPVSDGAFHFERVIKELVKAMPSLPNLRRLFLGDFNSEDSEMSWSGLGRLKDLWPVAGKLEYLKIHAGSMDLGKINAPELRELWVETGGFNKKNVESIVNANAPKLETLNLWFGNDNYGCDVLPKHLPAFVDALGKKFPKLKHLGIANAPWGNELAPLLVKSKVLKQLVTLDLSMSHLTDAGMKVYAASKDAFKHLSSIDFSRCVLEAEGKKLAKTLCKLVDVDGQDNLSDYGYDPDDPSDTTRYTAVGE